MTLECLVANPLRKQKFHQDCIELRSLIIMFVHERFLSLDKMLLHLKLQTCFVLPGLISANINDNETAKVNIILMELLFSKRIRY